MPSLHLSVVLAAMVLSEAHPEQYHTKDIRSQKTSFMLQYGQPRTATTLQFMTLCAATCLLHGPTTECVLVPVRPSLFLYSKMCFGFLHVSTGPAAFLPCSISPHCSTVYTLNEHLVACRSYAGCANTSIDECRLLARLCTRLLYTKR